jgi:hypothetical protein
MVPLGKPMELVAELPRGIRLPHQELALGIASGLDEDWRENLKRWLAASRSYREGPSRLAFPTESD